MKSILIVEDEVKIAQLLADYFNQAGYQAHMLHRGDEVIDWLNNNKADVMLLDLMLPGQDGMSICKDVRAFSQIPILMLTAKVEEIDRLLGLELGADDYICKPFSPREVVARVKAVLRRSQVIATKVNRLLLDEDKYQVSLDNKLLELTAVEFQLFRPMFQEPERVFSREQLMNNMYSDNRIVSDRTIDSHIKKLRKKFNEISPNEEVIQSVYGVGYKMKLIT